MKHIVRISILIALFASCKKDPPVEQPDFLTGDTSVFAGSWLWQYSEHGYGYCQNQVLNEVITPASANMTNELIFSPNGLMRHIKSGTTQNDFGIFFYTFGELPSCNYLGSYDRFSIWLNNDIEHQIAGCIKNDTLIINNGFLYEDYDSGCEDYLSYFTKQ